VVVKGDKDAIAMNVELVSLSLSLSLVVLSSTDGEGIAVVSRFRVNSALNL
jgi:hypothetical protein